MTEVETTCLDLTNEDRAPMDRDLETEIGSTLVKHYPFVSWIVEAMGKIGIVNIRCPELHRLGNTDFGFTLKIKNLPTYLDVRRAAVFAGGELLERAHHSRTRDERSKIIVDRG